MTITEVIEHLERSQQRLLGSVPATLRPFFDSLPLTQRAYLVTGPRGVGKTTFMLSQLRGCNGMYISADNPLVLSVPLYELIDAVFMQGYESVFIDEVHYAKDWSLHLKAVYDSFPERKIVISDSSSVLLRRGLGDLSRRFIIRRIPLLSLREYVYFKTGELLEVFDCFRSSPQDMMNAVKDINIMMLYRSYVKEGFRPIFMEGLYSDRLSNIIEKTIYKDIPFFVPQIADNHLRFMNAILGHLAMSRIPTVNVNSMCSKWEIGKRKLYQLLYAMEHTGLIRIIRKKHDTRMNSIGAKVFLEEPSMYHLFDGEIGSARECFVATLLQESGREVFASEDEEAADFVVDGLKVEVGGRNKKRKAADFVVRDDTDIPLKGILPMWCLGFGY